MAKLRLDFKSGTLGSTLHHLDTSITFGVIPDLPLIEAGDYLSISVGEEIVHLVGYEPQDPFVGTVLRGREGTQAATHDQGTAWTHALTAADLDDLAVEVEQLKDGLGEHDHGGIIQVVHHGSDPDMLRPDAAVVYWVGTVRPNNKVLGDLRLKMEEVG